jgi:TRAP-type C4-dicarboxylate transport system permease small subunit
MRRVLDQFILGCLVLAAVAMVLMATVVLLQIFGRLFGILVPSAPEIAGYCMAASSFLALAYTFKNGGHVRVSLLLYQLAPTTRRWAELICLLLALLLSGFFVFYLVEMTIESFVFGEVSSGVVAIPLWIPQTFLTAGVIALTLAVAEGLYDVALGRRPSYADKEELGH